MAAARFMLLRWQFSGACLAPAESLPQRLSAAPVTLPMALLPALRPLPANLKAQGTMKSGRISPAICRRGATQVAVTTPAALFTGTEAPAEAENIRPASNSIMMMGYIMTSLNKFSPQALNHLEVLGSTHARMASGLKTTQS